MDEKRHEDVNTDTDAASKIIAALKPSMSRIRIK